MEPQRVMLQDWCQRRWEAFGFEVTVCDDGTDDGPFNRSRAVNRGVAQVDAEIVIVADADIAPHQFQATAMVEAMAAGELYVIPYTRFVQINRRATDLITSHPADAPLPQPIADEWIRWSGNDSVCGLWAMRRQDYLDIGGNDERFIQWGGEDVSFHDVARTFLGEPTRFPYDLCHCWHPQRPDRKTDTFALANAALAERYEAAAGDEVAVTSLVREHLALREV